MQCVIYSGPDVKYADAEICVTNDYKTVSVWDVSDKENPIELASKGYANADLAHQGWFTEDQRYFIMGDEGDELNGLNTTTYIWDMSHLETPVLTGTYVADLRATDHNLYIEGNYVYQANYSSGLRILLIEDLSVPRLSEQAYFDTYPRDDDPSYSGAWSVFPYYASDTVAVSSSSGLFLLRPTFATE